MKVNGQIFQKLNFNFHLEEISGAPDRAKMSHGGNYSLISFCSTSHVVVREEETMQKIQIETQKCIAFGAPGLHRAHFQC